MSSKEERALNLEIHRMNRAHTDMVARNAALESECAWLRMNLKNECAKLAATNQALLQKCAEYQASDYEKFAKQQMERQAMIANIQREQDATMARLRQQAEEEALALKEEMIQTMEAHYADMIDKKTKELDATYMSIANEQKRKMEKEHNELVVATEKRVEDRIKSLILELTKTISFSQISHAIAANYAHTQLIHNLGFAGKRVLLYSHYSEHDEVESYNYLTLENMEARFDYIIILTNCPNKWDLPNPNYNKYHLLWYNFKSDFRNYTVFILQSAKKLVHASQLCLMNDSFVIVDVSAYERCMQSLFKSATVTHDFAGITSSHEGVYHVQSYFMLFNTTSVIKAAVNYFEMHGLPINHNASISVYELGMTQQLMRQGFVPHAMVSNAEMQFPLNTTYYKWSAVLQHAGIIKRQHILKQYPARFAMTDFNIALVASKFSKNVHFIHFLKYHGIKLD